MELLCPRHPWMMHCWVKSCGQWGYYSTQAHRKPWSFRSLKLACHWGAYGAKSHTRWPAVMWTADQVCLTGAMDPHLVLRRIWGSIYEYLSGVRIRSACHNAGLNCDSTMLGPKMKCCVFLPYFQVGGVPLGNVLHWFEGAVTWWTYKRPSWLL
jgi:hypothetical protein